MLKDDGMFLHVTYQEPHQVEALLNCDDEWDVTAERLSDSGSGLNYYGFIFRKRKNKMSVNYVCG